MKEFILFFLFLIHQLVCFSQPGTWTWIRGDSSVSNSGNFGIQGVASSTNDPPSLYEPAEFKDLQGNFWLFGGVYAGEYNDLWKYDPISNEWTWVKGSGIPMSQGNFGIKGVPSLSNLPPGLAWGVASWVDLNGDFWIYGGFAGSVEKDDLWKYNIASNTWTWMSGNASINQSPVYGTQGVPSATNTPGSRQEVNTTWVDSNNNLWLFGGTHYLLGQFNDLWKYDPAVNQWTWMKGPNMANQAGVYGTKGIASSSNVPSSRSAYCHWTDNGGNFWFYGGHEVLTGVNYSDIWRYEISTNNWTWMSGPDQPNADLSDSIPCVPSANNTPSARGETRCFWQDNNGNFWLYGGYRLMVDFFNIYESVFGDLWMFNPISLQWVFVSGDTIRNPNPSYGSPGIPSVNNKPGGRAGAIGWYDNAGYLYLFGGMDTTGGKRNDIWRYEIDPNCPTILMSPSVSLSSSDTNFCDKQYIDFFDLSTNSPTSWLWLFPGAVPSSSTQQNPTGIFYNSYGSFDVTLIACNAAGCDTLHLPNFIHEFQNPPIPVVTWVADTLFSTPAYAYQWYFNSTAIPGATGQFYVFQQPGDYFVIVTDSNGCSTPSVVLYTDLDEIFNFSAISIQPNPSGGDFILTGVPDNSIIKICDLAGRIIYAQQLQSDSRRLNFLASAGIYLLEITLPSGHSKGQGRPFVKKLIKLD